MSLRTMISSYSDLMYNYNESRANAANDSEIAFCYYMYDNCSTTHKYVVLYDNV